MRLATGRAAVAALLAAAVAVGSAAGAGATGKPPVHRAPHHQHHRPRHHRHRDPARPRAASVPARPVTPAKPAATKSAAATTSVPVTGLKLINYYPAGAGWTNMWRRWDPTAMSADFGRIASLGANAVRLTVFPSVTGFPVPSTTQVQRLAAAIDLAKAAGLRVQLTLFDWWSDWTDLSGSTQWLDAVVAPYRSDPEIAFVDLRNEVDVTNRAEATWVATELPVLRAAAGTVPVTVSVTADRSLTRLRALVRLLAADPPDFWDVHVYDKPGIAVSILRQAKAMVAPAELYVGETGSSSLPAGGASNTLADEQQAYYLQTVEAGCRALGLPPAAPWTYSDFAPGAVPAYAALPADGYDYGLFTTAGTEKPSGAVMKAVFSSGGAAGGLNGDFSAAAGGRPALWQTYLSTEGTLGWDPSVGHDAPGAVKLSGTSGGPGGYPSFWVTPPQQPTAPGQRFTASAWARGAGAAGVNDVAIVWFDGQDRMIAQSVSPALPAGTTPWTPLTVTSTAPAGAAYGSIYLRSASNPGAVWYDDVTWTEG